MKVGDTVRVIGYHRSCLPSSCLNCIAIISNVQEKGMWNIRVTHFDNSHLKWWAYESDLEKI